MAYQVAELGELPSIWQQCPDSVAPPDEPLAERRAPDGSVNARVVRLRGRHFPEERATLESVSLDQARAVQEVLRDALVLVLLAGQAQPVERTPPWTQAPQLQASAAAVPTESAPAAAKLERGAPDALESGWT
jgi:hypothetical protein